MRSDEPWTHRVAELRSAFDASFARASEDVRADTYDLIAFRLRNDSYAIRLSSISGIFADKRITHLPGSRAELLGIIGVRGALLPVYDLGALLGYPRKGALRWLVLTAETPLIGLAFDEYDGQVRVDNSQVAVDPFAKASQRHASEVLRNVSGVRPIIDVRTIRERTISSHTQHKPTDQER